jgi:hypothetical protein
MKYMSFNDILVEKLNSYCEKASCSVPATLRNLTQGGTRHEPRYEAVEASPASLMKWQPESQLPHTLLLVFLFLFHWINKPRIELGLRKILRLHIIRTLLHPYTRCKLQNKPANAITHRELTHAWFLDTKAWDDDGLTATFSSLGKGASTPNGNFAGPNSTQKQHTSCSLYPCPCPPWRTWLYGWRKQTDMLASHLCVNVLTP